MTTENYNKQSDKEEIDILTNNQDKKYNSTKDLKGYNFLFTKSLEREVSLNILSHE